MFPFPSGSLGAEAQGRRLRMLDMYVEARRIATPDRNGRPVVMMNTTLPDGTVAQEAISVSDFPTYMGSIQRHSFLGRFEEQVGAFREWTRPMSVPDFETYTTSRMGRFPDMPMHTLGGEYQRVGLSELPGPSIRIIEWGFAWELTRRLILSDRLDKFGDLPNLAADSDARTKSKRAVAILEANGNTYDGNALISTEHANISTTALTADIAGANLILGALLAIRTQTDPEGYKVVNPRTGFRLVYPTALMNIVNQLLNNDTLPLAVATADAVLRNNPLRGYNITGVEEPYLTDANNWYVIADPQGENGPIVRLTLNGNETPFIGLLRPEVAAIYGGDEPYSFEFDQLAYKNRDDFEFVLNEWRNIYGGIVA